MTITEVQTARDKREFLDVVKIIYKDIPAYIRPLDKDIEGTFDPDKNKYFRHGKAKRWILKDKGKSIGRVAAFVNDKYAKQFPATGGMGFFECVDNQDAAFVLFDTARDWLKDQGMEAMDGPINFGERDRFWGLTIENFDQSPYYGQNYNPEYYVKFFRKYGFGEFYQQLIYHRKMHDPVQEKFQERAARLINDPDYAVRRINKKDPEKLTREFRQVYNRAWGKREGENFTGMSEAQARAIMKALQPILVEQLAYFAYYKDEPIGFYISIPGLNEVFRKFDGKFGLWQKLQVFYALKMNTIKSTVGIVFGIDPDHQSKGVEALMFRLMSDDVRGQQHYQDVIVTWLGDFNGKMINIIEALGCRLIQKMATMRYQFDREKPFERHPMV